MKFKIPEALLLQAQQHAQERGMSIEEYIAEFIGMVKDEQDKKLNKRHKELANKSVHDKV